MVLQLNRQLLIQSYRIRLTVAPSSTGPTAGCRMGVRSPAWPRMGPFPPPKGTMHWCARIQGQLQGGGGGRAGTRYQGPGGACLRCICFWLWGTPLACQLPFWVLPSEPHIGTRRFYSPSVSRRCPGVAKCVSFVIIVSIISNKSH